MKAINIIIATSLMFYPTTSTSHFSLKEHFEMVSKNHKIPKGLLSAICYQESLHNLKIKKNMDSGTYSYGICQLKWATAVGVGFEGTRLELQNPLVNMEIAARYLKSQLDRYNNDVKKAVISYNAGTYKDHMKHSKYYKKVYKHWIEGR